MAAPLVAVAAEAPHVVVVQPGGAGGRAARAHHAHAAAVGGRGRAGLAGAVVAARGAADAGHPERRRRGDAAGQPVLPLLAPAHAQGRADAAVVGGAAAAA